MAYIFGDGFDCYSAQADVAQGYWDSTAGTFTLVSGRFAGSLGVQSSTNNAYLVKASGQNDAVHHISVAFNQSLAVTGTQAEYYIALLDGTSVQCALVFQQGGNIILGTTTAGGTTLATYPSAYTSANTWYQFEFEITIHNTAGRLRVRKNGNVSDDFDSGAVLNTRNGTANTYANKLQVGYNQLNTGQTIDDLLWRSDSVANGVPWVGDIRCFTRRPASDASVQWSRSGTGSLSQTVPTSAPNTATMSVPTAFYTAFIANYNGTITAAAVAVNAVGNAVNMKCAIHADNGTNAPGAVLASALSPVTPVVSGTNTFSFSGVSVVRGTRYWVAVISDGASLFTYTSTSSVQPEGASAVMAYATFPQANPVVTTSRVAQMSWTFALPASNSALVRELVQDAATTYVYSSNVGDSDLYTIDAIATTPASIVAVTTRGYLQKSDAGTRLAAVQLKSGATTVQSTPVALNTVWSWVSRTDVVDPATGSPWTAVGVNNVNIGAQVTA